MKYLIILFFSFNLFAADAEYTEAQLNEVIDYCSTKVNELMQVQKKARAALYIKDYKAISAETQQTELNELDVAVKASEIPVTPTPQL